MDTLQAISPLHTLYFFTEPEAAPERPWVDKEQAMGPLDRIVNHLQLTERIGTAGQPTEDQLHAVADAGYDTVINLAMPASTGALPNEREIVEGLGMEYVPIPVEWDAPKVEDARRFFDAMDARRDRRVFVHCAMNMRVSAFMLLYRTLREGLPLEEAEKDVHRIWLPTEPWQAFMDEVRGAVESDKTMPVESATVAPQNS